MGLWALPIVVFLVVQVAWSQNLQCPCVLKPGSTDCLVYDSRYQATSLQEAMSTFGDLTIEDDNPPDDSPITPAEPVERCTTPECKNCANYLKAKLKALGLLTDSVDYSKLTSVSNPCLKYRFSRNETGTYDYGKSPKKQKKNKDKDGDNSEDSSDEDDKHHQRKRENRRHGRRSKRQVAKKDAGVVGTRFNISCTTKGVSSDANGLLSLCSKCWAWRQLPPNYFPQYINEIICDSLDSDCLSGYATCGVGLRSLEVIRNDTGVATTVTINGGSYCECRVASGSALQGLVVGDGLTSSLPANTGN
uniref:Peptidase A1 domain-containing protein n=1 Tax=Steinernema glaseri TaxID=37863 RepID=A0A1I7ZF84_9BILA